MTMVCELSDLDAMNIIGAWLEGIILGHELRTLDAMNNSGLRMT